MLQEKNNSYIGTELEAPRAVMRQFLGDMGWSINDCCSIAVDAPTFKIPSRALTLTNRIPGEDAELSPHDVSPSLLISLLLMDTHRVTSIQLEAALQQRSTSEHAVIAVLLARAYAREQKDEQATHFSQIALSVNDTLGSIYLLLGKIHWYRGEILKSNDFFTAWIMRRQRIAMDRQINGNTDHAVVARLNLQDEIQLLGSRYYFIRHKMRICRIGNELFAVRNNRIFTLLQKLSQRSILRKLLRIMSESATSLPENITSQALGIPSQQPVRHLLSIAKRFIRTCAVLIFATPLSNHTSTLDQAITLSDFSCSPQ